MNTALNINSKSTSKAEPVTSKTKASKKNLLQQTVFNYKAKSEVKKTIKSLDEARQIREGKKSAKSFEQSIKEL